VTVTVHPAAEAFGRAVSPRIVTAQAAVTAATVSFRLLISTYA
jgi:hypothetical protein